MMRDSSPSAVKMITGTSDHDGCPSSSTSSRSRDCGARASSERTTTPTPRRTAAHSASMSRYATVCSPHLPSTRSDNEPSRPVGARTATSPEVTRASSTIMRRGSHAVRHERFHLSQILRISGQDTPEIGQRLPHAQAAALDAELADGLLMRAAPLLHDRDGASDRSRMLEVPKQDNAVGEVAHLGCLGDGRSEDPALHESHDHADPAIRQEAQELMHLN